MKIRIEGLCFKFPHEQGADEHHRRLELFLREKAARVFMPFLEREVAPPHTVKVIENIAVSVISTRLDLTLLDEEESWVPNVPLHGNPLLDLRYSQIVFVGDERRFHRARGAFLLEHHCEPHDFVSGWQEKEQPSFEELIEPGDEVETED